MNLATLLLLIVGIPCAALHAQTDASKAAPVPSSVPSSTEGTALTPQETSKPTASVTSMLPDEIAGFATFPAPIQAFVRKALELTKQNLRYQFGSSDPKAGGMDCSGTVFRVLSDCGLTTAPRQSDEMCRWVMRQTVLYRTEDTTTIKDPAFSALKPGDLLFWTGTYETSTPRELPVSHVMIYLGKRQSDGKPIIFGASDGRTFENARRSGVSVFDFSLPSRGEKSAFFGYGPVPGIAGAK
ncbi:MAG: C40 family peptidase [Roseimicrobium sp.]